MRDIKFTCDFCKEELKGEEGQIAIKGSRIIKHFRDGKINEYESPKDCEMHFCNIECVVKLIGGL